MTSCFEVPVPISLGESDAGRAAEDSRIVAAGLDPVNLLKQVLHEYVGFALFCAGGVLESIAEYRLMKDVSKILAPL